MAKKSKQKQKRTSIVLEHEAVWYLCKLGALHAGISAAQYVERAIVEKARRSKHVSRAFDFKKMEFKGK